MPGGQITPSSGGPYTFITLKGEIQSVARTVDDITRPGVDGHAYRENGKRGRIFEMFGLRDYLNHAAALAEYLNLQALQGQIVAVTDDRGGSAAAVMVLEVERLALEPMIKTAGGLVANSTYLMTTRFLMQNTTPPPS
jgi:hypothetical protein